MHGVQTALRNVPSKVEDCEQETYNDSTICAICQLQPEDMLIFACQHNLCIACATEVYAVSAHGSNRLACEICLEETQLDEETVICLKNLAKKDSHKSTAEKTDRSKVQARLPPRHKECDVGTCE